ncbi:hypothetical protein K431DRAFT_282887 [Polychaeton citri CBS 116435]|uniref:HAUS augmin-like complex subunit 1 n=1 Tax=Polychaeton citri CBS 116435 TaxID=1314669 RepID=A0A9P4QEG2_9PEZI|nr:hypothetical protein K431DRAFT_282887 [Polychaeton citri CBS 116435]
MDSEADWAASALFSPSKARLQQAQARDWSFVEAWLVRQYGKRLPDFERNENTLHVLLNLASLSEAADEIRIGIDRVEKSAIRTYQNISSGSGIGLQEIISQSFDDEGRQYLNAMVETCIDIDAPSCSALDIAMCLTDMVSRQFDLRQQLKAVVRQHVALKQEQIRLTHVLGELRDNTLQPADGLSETTAEWQRDSRHLRAKLGEYNDRIAASRSSTHQTLSLENYMHLREELIYYRNQRERLSDQAEAFENLPSNAWSAQTTMEAARDDLRDLIANRDRLFEALATKH